MIGSVLGKYRIEAELSRGGMGAVFRARHEIIDRQVAIKLLRPEMTTSPELVTRFINEARAASAIRHPSIIEIYDFGHTADGQAYLVMELLHGETVSERVAARGRLPEREAVQITRSILGALAAAHAKGIIHRDLKPDNVILIADPDVGERAKVLDFGIAKLADATSQAHTQTGALMGTPLYMAPEQARSAGAIDHRADLYSLGCILYELLTGKPPLVGEGAGEIVALHMFTQPDPPSSHVPELTPALESVVMKLLAKEPADRYASAADVSNALSALYGVASVRPATPSPAVSSAKPAVAAPTVAPHVAPRRSRNMLPILAAGITLALAGAVAIVLALGGRAAPAATSAPERPAQPAPIAQPAPQPPGPIAEPPAQPPAPTPAPTPAPRPVVVTPAPSPAPRAVIKPPTRPVRATDKGSPVETDLD